MGDGVKVDECGDVVKVLKWMVCGCGDGVSWMSVCGCGVKVDECVW